MSGVSLATADRSEPNQLDKQEKTMIGGVMGSLRVIELQLVAFIMVFSATGLVPLLDLVFPAFASAIFYCFLGWPSLQMAESVLARKRFFKEANSFGYTENIISGLSLFSPPVRALVPLLYTVRRIFVILDWIQDVWLNKTLPANAQAKSKDGDVFSVLKLLPAAILTLASVLSLEDREVLAYMITRSLKTTTNSNPNNPSSISQDSKRKSSKKLSNASSSSTTATINHKSPIFDCDCFDCYTSYWFRWDSSPNRELLHQVIEAFDEHLTNGEQSRKSYRGKRRDKAGRQIGEKPVIDVLGRPEMPELETPPETDESSIVSPDDDFSPVATPERAADGEEWKEKGAKKMKR
ncbi:hypothetical protein GH714_029842 [Hevea brasiliensis]|uniref:DUF7733 domain-containing protein n=1 Tax=Hevea brasiliensis TaxID=3981 RepID=A0A6A6KY72_HEVBR|nr:hypothetical protein GH714_029842 [Hevea brasiliensis]